MNRTWYAFRVMLSQARRDPLWALGCIIFYPLRLGVHALKVFLADHCPSSPGSSGTMPIGSLRGWCNTNNQA